MPTCGYSRAIFVAVTAVYLIRVAIASEDAVPEHANHDISISDFNKDLKPEPEPSGGVHNRTSGALPGGITGRPSVVEYRFGTNDDRPTTDTSASAGQISLSLLNVAVLSLIAALYVGR